LIHVDKDVTGAVHGCVSSALKFCGDHHAPGKELEARQGSAMTSRSGPQPITIRDLTSIDDLSQLKAVEKEVWGMTDEDTLPLTLAIACKAVGNIFVGAFAKDKDKDKDVGAFAKDKDKDKDKEKLVGFAFGFFGREHGQTTIHSHMLAVLDAYRHLDLGSRLKQAQRDRAIAMGVQEMTWTFDPLQSRNAHFNFSKLGVVSDTYKEDFYGPETSSMLHQNGTDRLWVRWLLNSRRVRDRLAGQLASKDARTETLDAMKLLAPLVRFDPSGKPGRADLAESLGRQRISIEIPGDILEVEGTDMGLAREWRDATRWAFGEAVKAGFFVAEFSRSIRGQQGPGAYLLQRGEVRELIQEM
jgi:predicted GNAT superfamily acetyltransferase